MDFYEVVSTRHSVREFRPDAVSRDIVERVIAAAASSPSSENEQPWEYYVTTGGTRQALGKVLAQTTVYLTEYMDVLGPEKYEQAVSWFSSLGDAPVIIAIAVPDSANEAKLINRLLSVGAAMENLLLAAAEEGLGACPFTFSYWVKEEVSAVLGVAEGTSVVSMIALGWPTEERPSAPDKRSDVAIWLD